MTKTTRVPNVAGLYETKQLKWKTENNHSVTMEMYGEQEGQQEVA